MKANEFIKKYGIEHAKHILTDDAPLIIDLSYTELKRLVESHELVEFCGGLEQAKAYAIDANACGAFNDERKLKQAILDVESCQ